MIENDPQDQKSILLHVKVVPGSSRDMIAGALGTRLKIKVAAAPEKGQANAAVIRLLSERFDIPESHIELVRGHSSPEKTLKLNGLSVDSAMRKLKG